MVLDLCVVKMNELQRYIYERQNKITNLSIYDWCLMKGYNWR